MIIKSRMITRVTTRMIIRITKKIRYRRVNKKRKANNCEVN